MNSKRKSTASPDKQTSPSASHSRTKAPNSLPRPFPASTIDAASRSRSRRQPSQPSQHPLPPAPPTHTRRFPALVPLENSIHPVFHQDRFPKLAPFLYETLAPTLRLATKFLTAEGMLEWWVSLFLSPLPLQHSIATTAATTSTTAAKAKTKLIKQQTSRPSDQSPNALTAIPVTEESLRHTESLLAAHADSVEFRFVTASEEAVVTATGDGAGTLDDAFASTHQDPRPGKEGKAIVLLGEGWLEGVVEEWQQRDEENSSEEYRAIIKYKEVNVGDEDKRAKVVDGAVKLGDDGKKVRVMDKGWRLEKEDEEEGRRLRVRVALAILLAHEVAHSVWVVRNATVAPTTASKSPQTRPLSSNLTSDTLPFSSQIPPEPYHHALESVAELGCSWEAFALSGGRIQPINLSPRCEEGLCWFAWPEPPSSKRRPQLLVPPDRDTDPRYSAYDRERVDRSRAENEVASTEYAKESDKERFWGVSMGWVREVCDREKWDWVELFGKQELRVRLLGEEGDGSGAACPFSHDGWREKRGRKRKSIAWQGQGPRK